MPKASRNATSDRQVRATTVAQDSVKEPLVHLKALDGIRGIAVLAVICFHLLWSNSHTGNHIIDLFLGIKGAGWAGVDLFFALSGFLITGILFDSLSDPHYFRNFYARRVLRIFPLYYGVVLSVLIGLFLTHQANAFNLKPLGLVAIYLENTPLYVNHALDTVTYRFTGYFWSLAVEEQFYFVWPALVFLVRSRQRLMILALALAALAPLVRAVLIAHHVPELVIYTGTYCRQDSLLCGAWLALAMRGPAREKFLRYAWIPFLLALLAVASVSWRFGNFDYNDNPAVNLYGYSLMAILGTSLIALSLRTGSFIQSFMSTSVLRFFGRYSFGLYVYHPLLECSPLSDMLHRPYWTHFQSKWTQHLVMFAILFAASILVSMLSYHLYEKPILSLKRYFNYDRRALRHNFQK